MVHLAGMSSGREKAWKGTARIFMKEGRYPVSRRASGRHLVVEEAVDIHGDDGRSAASAGHENAARMMLGEQGIEAINGRAIAAIDNDGGVQGVVVSVGDGCVVEGGSDRLVEG